MVTEPVPFAVAMFIVKSLTTFPISFFPFKLMQVVNRISLMSPGYEHSLNMLPSVLLILSCNPRFRRSLG